MKKSLRHRLKLIIELAGITQSKFAESLGISYSHISGLLNDPKKGKPPKGIGKDLAKSIAKEYGVDYIWLYEGKGEPPKELLIDKEWGPVMITIEAVIGGENTVDQNQTEPIAKFELPRIVAKSFTHGFQLADDSMHPTVVDGAYLGYDPDDKKIVENKLYCLNMPVVGLTVRRLQVEPVEKGDFKIRIISDNPIFDQYVLSQDHLEEDILVGRVKWVLQEV